MDDTTYGTRDRRGDWAPNKHVTYGPLFAWPPQPARLGTWLFSFPGFILPWNVFYAAAAGAAWFWTTPSTTTTRHLAVGWIAYILIRNLVLLSAWNSIFHVKLVVKRRQASRFKYNSFFPAKKNKYFSFGNQTKDNVFWSLVSGVSMWTAYEVITLWLFAHRHARWLGFSRNPIWFIALFFLIPLLREFHFHLVHRALHWPPLYKWVHSLHHRNINPTGWSGLSMHPVEHLLYFSGVIFHWVVLSHPAHAMFHLYHAALSPTPGHTGFDRFEVGETGSIPAGGFAHYLHHKYFEVNYSDGSIPLDRWFGSFHDGSPQADERMNVRLAARAAKAAARSNAAAQPKPASPG
jgi:sterol desaturase/sphingolipid hydroxylase (fatty acid hydroxylase superfamily)